MKKEERFYPRSCFFPANRKATPSSVAGCLVRISGRTVICSDRFTVCLSPVECCQRIRRDPERFMAIILEGERAVWGKTQYIGHVSLQSSGSKSCVRHLTSDSRYHETGENVFFPVRLSAKMNPWLIFVWKGKHGQATCSWALLIFLFCVSFQHVHSVSVKAYSFNLNDCLSLDSFFFIFLWVLSNTSFVLLVFFSVSLEWGNDESFLSILKKRLLFFQNQQKFKAEQIFLGERVHLRVARSWSEKVKRSQRGGKRQCCVNIRSDCSSDATLWFSEKEHRSQEELRVEEKLREKVTKKKQKEWRSISTDRTLPKASIPWRCLETNLDFLPLRRPPASLDSPLSGRLEVARTRNVSIFLPFFLLEALIWQANAYPGRYLEKHLLCGRSEHKNANVWAKCMASGKKAKYRRKKVVCWTSTHEFLFGPPCTVYPRTHGFSVESWRLKPAHTLPETVVSAALRFASKG